MSERLFDTGDDRGAQRTPVPAAEAPLAVRMRPRSLDELVGQQHLLGEGSTLRTAIETGEPHSMILYGPPGSGKTTLARIVATAARGAFEEESAVNAGRAEVRAMIERAAERRRATGQPTIFFLDEIHRFNKAQQDALLPAVEEGLVTLIGATTENPYFEVNSALLSRSQIYELRALEPAQVRELLERALADPERGIAEAPALTDDALELLAQRSGGDARTALAALERAVEAAAASGEEIDLQTAEDALQRKAVTFDKQGDRHYDYASALIKAMRGSDPDAAIYYLAAMLEGERTRGSSRGGWSSSPPRTSATPTPERSRWRRTPRSRSIGSASPSARSTSRRRPRTWRWRRSPMPRRWRSRGRWRRSANRGRSCRRTTFATPTTPGRRSWAAARATSTPTTSRVASPISHCSPTSSRARASTSPPTAGSRPSCASASTPPGDGEGMRNGRRR